MCPGSPNQTGQLGQTDPDPHTGVSHKGTVVSHPGTSVSSILLKRHIPDALAKVSEDVRDLWDTRGRVRLADPSSSILADSLSTQLARSRTLGAGAQQ